MGAIWKTVIVRRKKERKRKDKKGKRKANAKK